MFATTRVRFKILTMSFVPLRTLSGEFKILGSDFICEIEPLADANSFKAVYESFKKRHPKADHYPYAYFVSGIGKSSDDGEPGSTAGVPLLSLLQQKEIEGCVIVARYFGGTKLGTPRLRRAFLSSAEDALSHGGLGEKKTILCYDLTLDYSSFQTVKNNAERYGYRLENVDYDINVKLNLFCSDSIISPWEKMGFLPDSLPKPRLVESVEEITNDQSQ